jgi:hypothetical protein
MSSPKITAAVESRERVHEWTKSRMLPCSRIGNYREIAVIARFSSSLEENS